MTTAIRLLLSLALVAVVSSFGTGTLFGPSGAWAQTATNLKCNRCVNARDIARNAVRRNRIRNGAINLKKLESRLGDRANATRPFYVTANFNNAQVTILTHGPITIFMRCLINDAGVDRIRIFGSSSVDGWVTADQDGPFLAGVEVLLAEVAAATGNAEVDEVFDGDTVITPDGFVANYAQGAMTGVFNTLGHVCSLTGTISTIKGTP